MRTTLVLAAGFVLGSLAPTALDHVTCTTVNAESVSAVRATELIDAGYRGSPSDGSENLYSPSCLPDDAQLVVMVDA